MLIFKDHLSLLYPVCRIAADIPKSITGDYTQLKTIIRETLANPIGNVQNRMIPYVVNEIFPLKNAIMGLSQIRPNFAPPLKVFICWGDYTLRYENFQCGQSCGAKKRNLPEGRLNILICNYFWSATVQSTQAI